MTLQDLRTAHGNAERAAKCPVCIKREEDLQAWQREALAEDCDRDHALAKLEDLARDLDYIECKGAAETIVLTTPDEATGFALI